MSRLVARSRIPGALSAQTLRIVRARKLALMEARRGQLAPGALFCCEF
jgi:hypothetical protein